jgi:hypothetical protein
LFLQSIEELEMDMDDMAESEEALQEELVQLRAYARQLGEQFQHI